MKSRVIEIVSYNGTQIFKAIRDAEQIIPILRKMIDKPFDDGLLIGCIYENGTLFSQGIKKCPGKIFSGVSIVIAEIFLMHKGSVFVKNMIRPLKCNDLIWLGVSVTRNRRIHCFEIQKMNRIFNVLEPGMKPF